MREALCIGYIRTIEAVVNNQLGPTGMIEGLSESPTLSCAATPNLNLTGLSTVLTGFGTPGGSSCNKTNVVKLFIPGIQSAVF